MLDTVFLCGLAKKENEYLIHLDGCSTLYFLPLGDAVSSFFFGSYVEVAERFVGEQSNYRTYCHIGLLHSSALLLF